MTTATAATLITNIGQLVTAPAGSGPLRGTEMRDVLIIDDAAIAIDDAGIIVGVGSAREVTESVHTHDATEVVDAGGALVLPGFVDCHAHPVFAGDRAAEFELRNLGAGYEQIHAAGGGIRSTVGHTRRALSDGSIDERITRHFDWMIRAGTTTVEAKSGYALTLDGELESLVAAQRCAATHVLDVVGTVLAAHTVPAEFDGRADAFIDEVAIPALRSAVDAGVATAADIFLERGSFDATQARRYLNAARDAGLMLRLHGDQFSDSGAVALAVELGARSIDHLEALAAGDARLQQLAASGVASVLLPLSSLFLGRPYAPGRALIDAGGIVALASDFNPGSSYGESLTLAMSLATIGCGLRADEALTACTANAAWVLGVSHQVGRLAPGFYADFVMFDQPDLRHLSYHVGTPGITGVFKAGHRVA